MVLIDWTWGGVDEFLIALYIHSHPNCSDLVLNSTFLSKNDLFFDKWPKKFRRVEECFSSCVGPKGWLRWATNFAFHAYAKPYIYVQSVTLVTLWCLINVPYTCFSFLLDLIPPPHSFIIYKIAYSFRS